MTEPVTALTFHEEPTPTTVHVNACPHCGALVLADSQQLHDDWHARTPDLRDLAT